MPRHDACDVTDAANAPASPEHLDRLLANASKLLRDRDATAAKVLVDRVLVAAPEHLAARSLLALCHLELRQYADALVLYEAIDRQLPDGVNAKVSLGLVQIKLGRSDAARVILERAIEMAPEHRLAWGYLGIALEQLGLIEDAERALLAGRYAVAARLLRERHPTLRQHPVEFSPEETRHGMPAFKVPQRTLPPDAPAPRLDNPITPTVRASRFRRFDTTLPPPDFVAENGPPVASGEVEIHQGPTAPPPPNGDIPLDMIATPGRAPAAADQMTPSSRSVLPLLDAALASLLLPPSEAAVGVHESGLAIVKLMDRGVTDAGFVARLSAIQATVGVVQCVKLVQPTNDHADQPPPFSTGGARVGRFTGKGELILRPEPAHRLLPLAMDADIAFLREDFVVAFDHALLYDSGRVRLGDDLALSLVRFRGDGVVVLGLRESFLAFDVHGDQSVTLRADMLVGWVGLLSPAPVETWYPGAPAKDFVTFSGEGTVLFLHGSASLPRMETTP